MDYHAMATAAGCRPEAAEDMVRRMQARFAEEQPSPEAVRTWLSATLREAAPHLFAEAQTVWARLGMSKEQFDQMPVTWRLTQAYEDPSHVVEDRQTRRQAAQRERDAAQQGQG
jgi:hypothetical protein